MAEKGVVASGYSSGGLFDNMFQNLGGGISTPSAVSATNNSNVGGGGFNFLQDAFNTDAAGGTNAFAQNSAGFGLDTGNNSGGLFSNLGGFSTIASGLQAGASIWDAYNASKMAGLAEDQMNFQRAAYNQNTALQAQTINTNLEDRQNARNKDSTNNAISTEDFMKMHRVNVASL